jgi:D-alanyl-D-alanine carboxypeptidase
VSELRPRNRPTRAERRRRGILLLSGVVLGLALITVAAVVLLTPKPVTPTAAPTPTRTTSTQTPTPTPTPTPTFDTTAQSIDDAASLWVVVNKQRPLAVQGYEPGDLVSVPLPYINEPYLRQIASDAAVQMFAAITAETGLSLQVQSSYRSYSTQESVYAGWVSSLGQAGADLTSARPGHSEHQTGLAVDVNALPDQGCALEPCWGSTPHAAWIAENAHRFGFIVRYQDGMTPITGYEYEPYHLRYVGVELATEMKLTGIKTLEEFFGLPPAPDYG